MTTPTALIAEDEPLMRERLKEKLAEGWPELTIVAEAEDGDTALELFEQHKPDMAFLDIRMPGTNGLDVAAAIGARCHVVFITAYDQYALKAFETGAVDYLLKPVEPDRLAVMVERMKRKLATPPIDLGNLVARAALHAARRRGPHALGEGGGRQAGRSSSRCRRWCTSSPTRSTRAWCSRKARRSSARR